MTTNTATAARAARTAREQATPRTFREAVATRKATATDLLTDIGCGRYTTRLVAYTTDGLLDVDLLISGDALYTTGAKSIPFGTAAAHADQLDWYEYIGQIDTTDVDDLEDLRFRAWQTLTAWGDDLTAALNA